jgi:hypothetical protein
MVVLGRLRQEDHEFKASLAYIVWTEVLWKSCIYIKDPADDLNFTE